MAIFLKGTQTDLSLMILIIKDFSLISMDGAEFILVSIDTTISMKEQELAQ